MSFPSAPNMGGLRLAKLSDLPRIGLVAAAGFFHSQVFLYERPDFAKYPRDTVASYRAEYQSLILSSNSIVLVAEDRHKVNEADAVYEALRKVYDDEEAGGAEEKASGDKVIIGVMSIELNPGSARYGQFLPEGKKRHFILAACF